MRAGGGSEAVWKFSENSSKMVHASVPYLSIKELLKVGFKRLWEYGREGIIFESFSFAVGETAGFKVVRTNEVERCPQLLWNFQMGFHFWFQQKS